MRHLVDSGFGAVGVGNPVVCNGGGMAIWLPAKNLL